ncbi:MAG: hypothetical protein QNI84_04860 [Henriciella sp.]|nr:hypothetical protein [Henriciella sp.]
MKYFIIVLLALGACVSNKNLGERSVQHNQSLDYSMNVIMLSNIIRASERLPMTYSRLGSTKYTGSITYSPSWTFAVGPNQSEGTDEIKLGPTVQDSGVTDFTSLTGQKFYNGILNSIDGELISFYRDRGWPDKVLFLLFIEEIEVGSSVKCRIEKSNSILCRLLRGNIIYNNDPTEFQDFKDFFVFSNIVTNSFHINLVRKPKKNHLQPYCVSTVKFGLEFWRASAPFTKGDCKRLKGYRMIADLRGKGQVELKTIPKDHVIYRGHLLMPAERETTIEFRSKSGGMAISGCTVSDVGVGAWNRVPDDNCDIKITLRSPNDMVYYLGELLRVQTHETKQIAMACHKTDTEVRAYILIFEDPCRPELDGSDTITKEEPLFWIESGINIPAQVSEAYHQDDLYSFELNGRRYWISNDYKRRGRTMQFVALLNELFALNQEASEAPNVTTLNNTTIVP